MLIYQRVDDGKFYQKPLLQGAVEVAFYHSMTMVHTTPFLLGYNPN